MRGLRFGKASALENGMSIYKPTYNVRGIGKRHCENCGADVDVIVLAGGVRYCFPACYDAALEYGRRHIPEGFINEDTGEPLLMEYTVRIPGRGNEGFDRFTFATIEQAVVYIRGVVPEEVDCWIEPEEKAS